MFFNILDEKVINTTEDREENLEYRRLSPGGWERMKLT